MLGRTLALCLIAACYSPPQPDCGFRCEGGSCPEGYFCASDKRCHRDGTPTTLSCPPDAAVIVIPDSSPPADAAADAPPDAPDMVAPMFVSSTPADNATGVALDASVVVTFDEAVINVTNATFTAQTGSTTYTGTVSSLSPTTYSFDPDTNWPASTTIEISLTGGITDTTGNPLANAPVVFDFTTTN